MKYFQIFTIIFVVTFSQVTFAQTKKIMHRSHSGSNASFKADESEDNFGIRSDYKLELYQDSIYAAQKKKEKDSTDAANKKNKDTAKKKTDLKATVPKKTTPKSKDGKK